MHRARAIKQIAIAIAVSGFSNLGRTFSDRYLPLAKSGENILFSGLNFLQNALSMIRSI